MISVLIAGVERRELIDLSTLSYSNVLTKDIDTCSFTLETTDRSVRPQSGQEVVVLEGAEKRFAGRIIRAPETEGPVGRFSYAVEAEDYTYDLDRRKVTESYVNMTCGAVIRDIISKYAPGITGVNVQDGPVIDKIKFNYENPSAGLKRLAEISGYDWYVDYNKDLHFFARESMAAPFALTDEGGNYWDLVIEPDMSQVRNRVYVRGGIYASDPFTETLACDGVKRAWPLLYKPHAIDAGTPITVYLNDVQKTLGIENIDDPATKDFLLNYQEKVLKAGTNLATPASGSHIDITYRYEVPVMVQVDDELSQAAMKALVGGDGVFEHVIQDETINSLEIARQVGEADLAQYANPRVTASFKTRTPGLRAGMTIQVTISRREINRSFLITSVTARPVHYSETDATYVFEYSVSCETRLMGLEVLLAELLDKSRKPVERDDETIDILRRFNDPVTIPDTLTTTTTPAANVLSEVALSADYVEDDQADFAAGTHTGTQATAAGLALVTEAAPTFNRASVAYKRDGSQVASGVPRYETGQFGQGLMVEEGTTNIANPNPQTYTVEDWSGGSGATAVDGTTPWGLPYRGIVPAGTSSTNLLLRSPYFTLASPAGKVFSASMAWKGNVSAIGLYSDDGLYYQNVVPVVDQEMAGGWKRGHAVFPTIPANYTGSTMFQLLLRTNDNVYQTLFAMPQIEEKSYATSFANSTRPPETLTIPTAGVLNAAEGTVEFTIFPQTGAVVPSGDAAYNDFTWGNPGVNGFLLRRFWDGANWQVQAEYYVDGTTKVSLNYAYAWAVGEKLSLAFRWSSAGCAWFVNGVLRASDPRLFAAPSATEAQTGYRSGFRQGNAIYDDLRISSIARSDTEILAAYQSGAALPVDKFTTYKLAFDGNLNHGEGGYRLSPVLDPSNLGTSAESLASYSASTPAGTTATLEVRKSTDSGVTWGDWQTVTNGTAIPVVTANMNTTGLRLQTRATLLTNDTAALPVISRTQLTLLAPYQQKHQVGFSEVA